LSWRISGGTDGSDGYYDLDYTYAKATTGRNTIRKSTMVMPVGSTLTYEYLSTNSLHDTDASRVTRVKVRTTAVAAYAYNGVDQLVGIDLPQPDVFKTLYDPRDLDDYDRLDNFGRVSPLTARRSDPLLGVRMRHGMLGGVKQPRRRM